MTEVAPLAGEITRYLSQYNRGSSAAFDALINLVYQELHGMAKRHLKSQLGSQDSLPPTGLVHEVYIRLRHQESFVFENRKQFFWFAGRLTRQVILDRARRKTRLKRGGQAKVLNFEEVDVFMDRGGMDPETWIVLDEALSKLWEWDRRQCQIVEMRFFAGLQIREISELLEISPTTVKRDWSAAKLWLAQKLFTSGPTKKPVQEQPQCALS